MPRTPQARQMPVDVDFPAVDQSAFDGVSAKALEVIKTYKLQSANPDVLVTEIRSWQQTAVESLFQVGARLLLLARITPHGEWLARLDGLGMNERTARRIMQATVKYTGDGKQRSEKLLTVGKSKMLELMMLDDEDIDVLDAGGQVGELDLDDVARMGVSELRHAVRELRATEESKDMLIQKKDQKINDLDVKLKNAKKFKPSSGSEAQTAAEQAQLDELAAAVREAELAFTRLAVVTADIVDTCPNEAVRGRAAQSLRYIQARINECAEQHGFAKLEGDHTPEWLKA
jgi:hypothetical protein